MSEPNFPTVSISTALKHEPDLPHPDSVKVGRFKSFPLVVRKEIETDYRHTHPQSEERFVTTQELRFQCIADDNGNRHWRVVNAVYL